MPPPPSPYSAQIRLLREIADAAGLSLSEKLHRALEKTAALLDLETGFISHVRDGLYTVQAVVPRDGDVSVGDTFALDETYCQITVEEGDVVAIDAMGESPHADLPCYAAMRLEAYVGAPVHVGGAFYGTLCFASARSRPAPFTDADADLLRLLASWVGTALDRMEADDALRKSTARLAGVLASAPDAVLLTTTDRVIEYVSPSFEALFGWSADDVIGRSTRLLYARADEYERQGAVRFHSDGAPLTPTPYVVSYRRADGSTFLGETVAGPVRGEEPFFVGFVRDVTTREEARATAAAGTAARAEAVRAKERFLANMSHEMRTPLNAVLGLSHLLGQTPLDPGQAGLLDGITTSAGALLALIDDLLDFARLGAGRLPFETIPYRPAEVAGEVQTILQTQADAKGLPLLVELAPAVPEVLLGDPTRLRQVLMNLASNAIKFTAEGHVRLRLDAAPAGVGEVRLLMEVSDTGCGIPPDRLGAIFDPFTQAADDAARLHGGTGLGLAIVKDLVERQGGAIEVESTEGVGSTFRAEVVAALPPPESADDEDAEDVGPPDVSGLRVLVVEDNAMNRLVARRTLEAWGIDVEEARDGAEGVEAVAERGPFDLVLMDLQMPGMDGIEATRHIRRELGLGSETLPILALTASVLAYQQLDVLAAGLDDFLLKPFDPDLLRERIAAWTGRRAEPAPPPPNDLAPDHLERYTLGDPDLAHEVLGLFQTEGLRLAGALALAASRHDLDGMRAAAHALKGQAGYVGALALGQTTERILQALRAGETDGLSATVQDAIRQYRAAANELRRLYPRAETDAA